MADTKITALTAISTVDPAVDVFPIVDVSDTTMAASGTTKKITSNQLLGAGGTATLASATITGDLTVDTSTLKVDSANNRVGIVTASPSFALDVNGAGSGVSARISSGSGTGFRFDTTRNVGGLNRNYLIGCDVLNEGWFSIVPSTALGGGTFTNSIYNASYDGTHTWNDGAGSERMRLNSTGLGVGTSPSYRLEVRDTADAVIALVKTGANSLRFLSTSSGGVINQVDNNPLAFYTNNTERARIDSSGNFGLGVTPSAWGLGSSGYRAFEIGAIGNSIFSATNDLNISSNAYYLAGWKYGASSYASQYSQGSGKHIWYTAPSGTAGNAITFTQAMTLDASGILAIGTVALGYTSSKSTYFSPVVGYWIGNHTTGTPSGDRYWGFGYGVNELGSITQDGTTGVLYNTTSDYRLKESVQPLSGGLSRVNALKPSIYKWKADGSNGEGFLAHELAAVVPLAVTGEKDAVNEDGTIKPQGVDLSKVVPILVAAIQELAAEVNALKNA